jgi:hypothetical protein
MDYGKVLKQSWHGVRSYRALWVFGIILALTVASGSSNVAQYGSRGEDSPWRHEFQVGELPPEVVSVLLTVGVGFVGLVILLAVVLAVVATVARYVSETALIRMVDEHEETGQQRSVWQGFRMGWSRASLRLFLIALLIGVPTVVAFILLFGLASAPLLLWATRSIAAGAIGTLAAVAQFFVVLLLSIVVSTALSLLRHFFWRACVLEDLGVVASMRRGLDLVMHHLKDTIVMWVIMVVVRIGWGIARFFLVIALLPIVIILIVLGSLTAGVPALLVLGVSSIFLEGALPWILAGLVGIPIFALAMAVVAAVSVAAGLAGLFLDGLMETFKSSVWTLAYREMRRLSVIARDRLPEASPPSLEAVPAA